MSISDGIDVTPQSTMSTIQFQSEALNTVITSLLTTLVIANLVSVINRLVFLSRNDLFCYRSFARAYVFLNSDDPLRLWYWLRGRYEYRGDKEPPLRHKIRKRRLIAPLFARLCILVVSIGSIALALPSEKRLDACSRGDYNLVQSVPNRELVVPERSDVIEVCAQIPLETRLGTVRSSASFCSFALSIGDLATLADLSSSVQELPDISAVAVGYENSSGLFASVVLSRGSFQGIGAFVEWRAENGDRFRSLLPSWTADRHVQVVVDAINSFSEEECSVVLSVDESNDVGTFRVAALDCNFDADAAIRHISIRMRESLSFQREQGNSLKARLVDGSEFRTSRTCAIDVTVQRPLINIVPLFIGLVMAFVLNVTVMCLVSRYGNTMDGAYHIVREVLGHDTGANPLQIDTSGIDVENVALKKFVCADGVSAHVGFIRGVGDNVVEDFGSGLRVGRCMQVACRGARFVTELSEKVP
ncbi:hypothetical protein FGB62_282g01 [Gracilaria domingensis]|nr:hypothetical protein FGB62_282g01 [Gracilaria domingensis]